MTIILVNFFAHVHERIYLPGFYTANAFAEKLAYQLLCGKEKLSKRNCQLRIFVNAYDSSMTHINVTYKT